MGSLCPETGSGSEHHVICNLSNPPILREVCVCVAYRVDTLRATHGCTRWRLCIAVQGPPAPLVAATRADVRAGDPR